MPQKLITNTCYWVLEPANLKGLVLFEIEINQLDSCTNMRLNLPFLYVFYAFYAISLCIFVIPRFVFDQRIKPAVEPPLQPISPTENRKRRQRRSLHNLYFSIIKWTFRFAGTSFFPFHAHVWSALFQRVLPKAFTNILGRGA